jgi:CheY-like chemotaxis protein
LIEGRRRCAVFSLEKLQVLFADDEVWEMRPTIDALIASGADVTIKTDGTEVLDYLRKNRNEPPQLIVLDIMMPEGSEIVTGDDGRSTGVHVHRQIRETLRMQIPIVVSTVVTDDAILASLAKDKRVVIIKKPYRFEDLSRAIESVMRG